MPATYFTNPPTRATNFIRNTASRASTSAVYYQFKNYVLPGDPSPSEMVICRNEEDHATTIITPRLLLRSFNQIEEADLMAGLRDIFMDPINVRQYWDGVAWSEERIHAYIQEYSAAWAQGKKFSVYVIYDVLNPNKIIGTLDLWEVSLFAGYENTVDLGYILLLSEHGKKIGKEMGEVGWQAFVHEVEAAIHAGDTPPTGLAATAHPDNTPSVSILKHVLGDAVPGVALNYGVGQPRHFFFRPYTPGGTLELNTSEASQPGESFAATLLLRS
jgi:RimJ/RimL family protein N-acetyltransferase